MVFETDIWFNLIKTILTTALTLGLMISLTEFRFSYKVVVLTYSGYMLYVGVSSILIIMLFGFSTLLSVFLLTITAPAIVITYFLAKDYAMKAIFNYMTQIDICLLLTIPAALMNHGNKTLDIFLRVMLLSAMIAINYIFIRKPFRRLADILEGNWLFLALVPTAFCILIFLTVRFPVHFTRNPWSLVLLGAIAVVMLIVYFVIFQSLNNGYKLLAYEQEKEILYTHVNAMKNRMETIQHGVEQATIYRHDLRHHANLLTAMLREGTVEEALSYVQKFGDSNVNNVDESYCENLVVNTILFHYMERATKQGVVVKCKAVVPKEICIDEMELCTVLSNLLENAVEHCIGLSPHLTVSIRHNKRQLWIRIENSFDGIVKQDEHGSYHSTKPQGGGIGLRSVDAIVRKYQGVMNISHNESCFTADIAFMFEKS